MVKKRYSITLTDPFQKGLEELVERGLFINHQHAIREGLRCILERYDMKPFSHPIKEAEGQ